MVLDIENLSITLTSKSIGLKEELVSLFFSFFFFFFLILWELVSLLTTYE